MWIERMWVKAHICAECAQVCVCVRTSEIVTTSYTHKVLIRITFIVFQRTLRSQVAELENWFIAAVVRETKRA